MKAVFLAALGGLTLSNYALAQFQSESEMPPQQLAEVMEQLKVEPIKNAEFTDYYVKDTDAMTMLPVKMAVVGADKLSVAFLKKYNRRLADEHFRVILLGDGNTLKQFKEAYPDIENVSLYKLDDAFHLMAYTLGIKYYPSLYDEGHIKP